MGSGEEEALSDLEDDAAPIVLPSSAGSLKSVLAELETERHAKKVAEAANAELVMRFKNYTQDASRQKEEAIKQKEEAQRLKEELAKQLNEAIRQRDEFAQQRDEALKVKDDLCRQRDEASKARDLSRSEIEAAVRLLVAGAEKITTRVSSIKSLPGNLPRSSSHTGVAAITYSYTKRAEDIVEELARQYEIALKSRSELREQMEQQNYEMAIEMSEMEASIQSLKDEMSQKSSELDRWQKMALEKEGRVSEVEQEMSHKLSQAMERIEALKINAQDTKHRGDKIKDAILQLSDLLSRANEAVANLAGLDSTLHMPSANNRLSPSSICAEPEEAVQDCVTRLKELVESCLKVGATLREHREINKKDMDDLEGTITRLITEKEEITNFLRSALANKQEVSDAICDTRLSPGRNELSSISEIKTGEAISMASALENKVKSLRREIFELQQSLAVARGEVEWLGVASDRQAKELTQKTSKIQELEEKQSLAEDHIEGLNMDLAAAQEEILRWKQAAMKEAEAGGVMLEEVERCQEEIAALKRQIEQLSQSLEESNSKLQSKEEMTVAAIAARNAAERSLRIADERAVELRERNEELNSQFDSLERLGDGGISTGLFNMCWPYRWFGGRPMFLQGNITPQPSAEMGELFEPLV